MLMELQIFLYLKINGISTITIKIEEGCQPFLQKIFFFLFLKYSITILNEKKPTQILERNLKFLTNITTMLITTFETIHLALHVERFKI